MRVYGPNGTASPPAPAAPARGGRHFHAVARLRRPQAQSAAVALRTLGGIDALIALQGVEDPAERRRRAVKQAAGRSMCSMSSSSGCSAGTLDRRTLLRLKSVAADLKDGSGDDGLDHGPGRDRPAGRGRTGQSRHELARIY